MHAKSFIVSLGSVFHQDSTGVDYCEKLNLSFTLIFWPSEAHVQISSAAGTTLVESSGHSP